jgi:hypothetical protein
MDWNCTCPLRAARIWHGPSTELVAERERVRVGVSGRVSLGEPVLVLLHVRVGVGTLLTDRVGVGGSECVAVAERVAEGVFGCERLRVADRVAESETDGEREVDADEVDDSVAVVVGDTVGDAVVDCDGVAVAECEGDPLGERLALVDSVGDAVGVVDGDADADDDGVEVGDAERVGEAELVLVAIAAARKHAARASTRGRCGAFEFCAATNSFGVAGRDIGSIDRIIGKQSDAGA